MVTLNRIEETYRRLIASGRRIARLFSGNPNEHGFRFPPEILKSVYDQYFEVQEYQPHPKGLAVARLAIAGYYERAGAAIDPENVIITSGTSESFLYLFSLLAGPGDNILTPNPSYPLFDEIARVLGVELHPYHLLEEKEWRIDLADLRKMTDDRTRAIVLISPHNPTGAVARADEIREITDWANQRNIPLLCDEVFSEFWFGTGSYPRPIAIASPKLCFTLNGISKMFALPAMKLGWIAVTGEKSKVDPAVDRLETIADTFLSCHTPIQMALPALFEKGQEFLQGYCEEVGRRRRLAIDLLHQSPQIRFNVPVGGFYLMVQVEGNPPISEEEFVIRLMEEKGFFIHPGYFYDYEKGIHGVISFLTRPEELRPGLESLKA